MSAPQPAQTSGFAGLRQTSWALLGLLAWGDELSGYDLKKWADYSVRFVFWSPSFSQVYSELKKLEKAGYVSSRTIVEDEDRVKPKRVYRITPAGLDVLREWSVEAPVDLPVLKHPTMLRLMFGFLSEPEQLKHVLREHISYVDGMSRQAAIDVRDTSKDPEWAFQNLALRWAERYYAAERELATELLDEIDATFEKVQQSGSEPGQPPVRRPGSLRGIAKRYDAAEYEEAARRELPSDDA
ncbi:PadR family transcriptional regulator [Rhodococcus sp. D2-41]|uniref:PadR family transcriptional regulator n=1 Tax=Speluncibacter jeojiensis TaxID=2710754 RepID=A0A9X4LZZ2_9ACTN|nr:helix-turn-helix transcriptional regulator [Rhodococcus sp. D2-41]MDG3009751.1 PadR family transcriptional regulator [Rhodococcus sp. D2-41]MDG3014500.1 PadR family transcriptional regulator [Corynebacteriales bacterium D3-21]